MSTIATAARIKAPSTDAGDVTVQAVTTTAGAATALVTEKLHSERKFYRFQAHSADVYLTLGGSGITAPDQTATSGAGRCIVIPAGTYMDFMMDRSVTHFRAKGSAAGYIRIYRLS